MPRRPGLSSALSITKRLIDSLELHFDGERFRVAPGVRGRSAVETLLTQRSQSYKWITYHHRVVGSNLALSREFITPDHSVVQTMG